MLPPVVADQGFFALWHPEVVGSSGVRLPNPPPVPRFRYLSLVMGYRAVGTPLKLLANRDLLTAHRIQLALLSMAMPPLFLIGLPAWLLPSVIQNPLLRTLIRVVTRPEIALVLFTAGFLVFQFPLFLETTLRVNGLYVLDQDLMMRVSIALWWPIYNPSTGLPAPMLILWVVFIQEFFRWVHEERAQESLITIPTHHIRNPLYPPRPINVVKDQIPSWENRSWGDFLHPDPAIRVLKCAPTS